MVSYMEEETTESNVSYINLETPKDARVLICDVLSEIRDGEMMAEHSGKICNLLQIWLKCYQIEQMSEIERRLTALEEQSGLEIKK